MQRVLGFILSHWPKLFLLGIIITSIVLVSIHGFAIFGRILNWFKARDGWGGWGVYVGFYTGLVSLFFPGIVFIMGAGFVFGFWRGLLAVWIGGSVGQALAFLLARYLLHDWVESMIRQRWKKWKYIDAAIENEGWKLVLVMRLSPIIPYNMLNIGMALTSIHVIPFALVSSIGIIFECSIFVYLGTMADSITSIVSGESGAPKAYRWVLMGLSIAGCIITAIMVSFIVRRAIKRAEMSFKNPSSSTDAGEHASEEESLLGGTMPSALERESFVDVTGENHHFQGSEFESEKGTKVPKHPISGALRALSEVGTMSMQLISPLRYGNLKVKLSPPGSEAGRPSSESPHGDGVDSSNQTSRDVEMGEQHSPLVSSRRRISRPESVDYESAP